MNAIQFIEKHIVSDLVKHGYHPPVARQCANKVIDYYHRCASDSGKGKMFNDCLNVAKSSATKLQPKSK